MIRPCTPPSLSPHNVFHTKLLRKAAEDRLSGQIEKPSLPIIIRNEEEWEVDEILDARKHYSRVQFKVKWTDRDEDLNW